MIIVPKPQEMLQMGGFYEGRGGFIVAQNDYEKVKKDLLFFGIFMQAGKDKEANVFFYDALNFKEEEYELWIDEGGIKIISGSQQGRFRALSTLKQILAQRENGSLPCLKIHDFPDIPVRGLMLFVSSKCIYTMNTLFEMIDRLAELKYNMLQLYFDTFVFEYESFRKHLEGRVYYSKEEIRQLDAYCKERHIELQANVETFGHLSELLSCEEFKHLGITRENAAPFTINPLLEESFELVKSMLDDLLPHFSSTTVHIGMDETYGMGESETAEYCKAFGTDGLFIDFLKKVSGYAKEKHGKRSMIWGDIAAKYPKCLMEIPKDVIYVDWGYEPGHKFDRNAIACREAGLDFYVSPGTQNWGTITGRTDIMVQNIYFAAESARAYGAAGFLLTDWSIRCTPSIAMLAYVFGGAFSWNSGYSSSFSEAHNEMDCCFRYEVIQDVLKYCDMFLWKCTGKSCAELIYRMGNYWYLEQPASAATWNGTILSKNFFENDDSYPLLSEDQLRRIYNYMKEIREELSECSLGVENADKVRKELECVCDLTLFAADALMGRKTKVDLQALIDGYQALGEIHNCRAGKDGMIARIEKWRNSK